MSVSQIDSWRRPGCGASCSPRWHDLEGHERYGYEQATARLAVVEIDGLRIDLDAGTAAIDGALVPLTGREWAVLAYLARRPGRATPSDEIERDIWGSVGPQPGHAVRVAASRLRARLGDYGALIVNLHGRGYGLRRSLSESVRPVFVPRRAADWRWSRDHDACRRCGTTDLPHVARGLCTSCHARQHREGGEQP